MDRGDVGMWVVVAIGLMLAVVGGATGNTGNPAPSPAAQAAPR